MSEEKTNNQHGRHEIEWYGWIPDLPDQRDHYFGFATEEAKAQALPPKLDMTQQCPPVYDQGQLGSCTGNAIAGAMEFKLIAQQKNRDFIPSRLFIYYNERVMEHTVNEDAGAMIRDGIKSVVRQGVCHETSWPYIIRRFAARPPNSCYAEAMKFQALRYQRLDNRNLQLLKYCLSGGNPFVFGFTVYQSFESSNVEKTGTVPMPQFNQERALGGHAMLAVGYDDAQKRFIVRNSWGNDWGAQGYCTMPYDYLTNDDLAADFWAITLVETQQ